MSEKLCTLRTKGGGGGKYTETSLWTNPSPSSNFSGQTVTLSQGMSNFKYIAIKYKTLKTQTESDAITEILTVEDFNRCGAGSTSGEPQLRIGGYSSNPMVRLVNKASDTSITFSLAYRINASANSSEIVIPLEILGLNELAHGTKYTTNASEIAFKSVSANTIPTFTTVAEAKAIWLTINYASAYRALQITNVNPTTGEINNDSLYKIDTNSLGNIEPLTGNKFIVTSNSVTMQNAPSTAATQQSLIYTY